MKGTELIFSRALPSGIMQERLKVERENGVDVFYYRIKIDTDPNWSEWKNSNFWNSRTRDESGKTLPAPKVLQLLNNLGWEMP